MRVPISETVSRQGSVTALQAAVDAGARMQMAYAWFPGAPEDPEVRYIVHAGTREALQVWRCRPGRETLPSLAAVAPLLSWYERRDGRPLWPAICGSASARPLVLLPGATGVEASAGSRRWHDFELCAGTFDAA